MPEDILKLTDKQIRNEFFSYLRKKYKDYLVLEEIGIGRSICDVGLFSSDHFIGIEIKSEQDNLKRLRRQVKDYNKIFDQCHLIAHQKHISEAKKIIPFYWGLIEVWIDSRGEFLFNEIRSANKKNFVNRKQLTKLLWKDEIVKHLKDNYNQDLNLFYKTDLASAFYTEFSSEYIKKAIYDAFIEREEGEWLENKIKT